MTRAETSKLVTIFRAAFPAWSPETTTVDAWHVLLGDLDYHLVELAAKIEMMSSRSQWPPSPGQLRATVANLTDAQISADEAWAEAQRRVQRLGRDRDPGQDNIGQACKTVGWRFLCNAKENDPAMRAHFRNVYELQQKREEHLKRLPTDVIERIGRDKVEAIGVLPESERHRIGR